MTNTLTDITPEEERRIEAMIKGAVVPKETYSHNYTCFNCGFVGVQNIEKGTRVIHHRCPRCACTDADLTGQW